MRQGFASVSRHQLLIHNIPPLAKWQDVKDVCKQYGACLPLPVGKSGRHCPTTCRVLT